MTHSERNLLDLLEQMQASGAILSYRLEVERSSALPPRHPPERRLVVQLRPGPWVGHIEIHEEQKP